MKTHKPKNDQGIILAIRPFTQKERPLTPKQKAALEKAGEVCGISWRIRTVKAPTQPAEAAIRYGRRCSLGSTRAFATDQAQMAYWANLIAGAKPSPRARV